MWFAQSISTTSIDVTTTESTSFWAAMAFWWFVYLIVWVLMIVAVWKVFTKAGEAGWKSIIPFYSSYILFRIAGRNGWWFLALFVPLVNIFVLLMLGIDLAKHFGKSTAFGVVALWLFSVIGYLVLGYGDAKYVGPKHD
jgi:glycopeptide antibiotics resistance protein